jgi:hypothetical protein
MRFFHIRNTNAEGNVLPNGGTTVGYQWVDPKVKDKLFVTFARCSEKDTFLRKKSLLICEGRFRKGKFKVVDKPADVDMYELLHRQAMEHDAEVKAARTAKHG